MQEVAQVLLCRLEPLMVTVVPPAMGPDVGTTDVIVGAGQDACEETSEPPHT